MSLFDLVKCSETFIRLAMLIGIILVITNIRKQYSITYSPYVEKPEACSLCYGLLFGLYAAYTATSLDYGISGIGRQSNFTSQ